MAVELDPPWRFLSFMSPLSEARAARLARFVADGLDGGGTVVDIGCGWAELLLRVVAATPAASAVGIELEAGDIEHAREVAAQRGLAGRVTLIAGDATVHLPDRADAAICLGASHVWNPPGWNSAGVTPEPLDYGRALRAIRALLDPGARLAYGDAIWSAPPTPRAAAPFSGRLDEFVMLPELAEIAAGCGFAVQAFHEAGLDEWDEFESGVGAADAAWLAAHPHDHPDASEVRERAERHRHGYLSGYRGVMGMGYLELLAA